MTHVVNLLPWRDLRRRQRLRYVLLLTIGIVLLGGMGLLVSRTARLQRDAEGRWQFSFTLTGARADAD